MKMGLQFGLQGINICPKRQFRWLFEIPDVCGDNSPGANALPPEKAARPSLAFKEMEVNHLIEDVYYPAKPDWKPITITVFDLVRTKHPVFYWLLNVYDAQFGEFYEPNSKGLMKDCALRMLNGCGDIVETWWFEDCYPQAINFNTLDMTNSGIVYCDVTLRYARAYIERQREEDDNNLPFF
jgi:hypothetical protein